ncbi:hypothetical protein N6H18_07430 [Reichenbachiella agarivorans]|uniref:Tetratricopeptide repeat-containing protein n=1 Tax=Reichenbachiella agarivorans TaxID=2979464 RepID=A0ABY6CWL0_9BACT|nr:hypothetical protein [Reichenbachiella agarivorans]UXP33778.1 hypothetical protein N6H18_07430 [Reichenbachiella agarivorans]
MGVIVVLLALSGIGSTGLFGLDSEFIVGGVSVLIIALAYYFHDININRSYIVRLGCFVLLFCVLSFLITYFSTADIPLLAMAQNVYWIGMILGIIFTFLVGHEVVYGILVLTTQGNKSNNSNGNGLHFLIFSLIYLLNVALVYMRSAKYVDWDIYYINPYLLLSASAILGIRGLKGREDLYRNTLSFKNTLVIYMALGFICFSSILHFSISGNDSAMEVMEDAIIFGHIGFGAMFFIYVMINFVTLLLKGLPIYKIAFKEDNFPYATSKLAGMIVVAAFFFAADYVPLNQAISGYYNQLGDMNLSLGKESVAKENYRRGAISGNVLAQSNHNHKSNYMYALLLEDYNQQAIWLHHATQRHPSEQAFVGLGMAYERANRFFEAVFAYQDGIRTFPESWALKNNLALLYQQINESDSAVYYLQNHGNANSWQSSVMQSNALALAVANGKEVDETGLNMDRIDVQTNLLARRVLYGKANVEHEPLDKIEIRLNLFSYSYLRNLGLSNIQTGERQYLDNIDLFLQHPDNDAYSYELSLIKAMNLYTQGMVADAFVVMNHLAESNSDQASFLKMILGKWSMELESPLLAAQYFEIAHEYGYPLSMIDLVQAYAQIGKGETAQYLLSQEIEKLDITKSTVLKQMSQLEQSIAQNENPWSKNQYSFDHENKLLRQAQELQSDTSQLSPLYLRLGEMNPFYEQGVIAAATYFDQEVDNPDQAYGILVDAIEVNEYSAPLIMAYIDQCLKMGLTSYAESSVIRLIDILDESSYQAYEVLFEQKRKRAEESFQSW